MDMAIYGDQTESQWRFCRRSEDTIADSLLYYNLGAYVSYCLHVCTPLI